jgi:plasmid stabilization system protein ParE
MSDGGRPLGTGPTPAEAANGIRAAVLRWLETLDLGQRAAAVFDFGADERFAWDYRPGSRRGFALRDMTDPQRAAAMAIVDAAMSGRGAAEVRSIIALEPILGDLERRSGGSGIRRDPELYWFAVFGEPGGQAPWSWRIGGHHLAVHSTLAQGRVVGTAPSFLGANPATVPDGPLAGHRAIDGEEHLARALLVSLAPEQRRLAVVDPVAPPDILSGNGRLADPSEVPTGVRHDQLGPAQQAGLEALIRHYVERAHPDVAAAEWDRIRDAGLGSVSFAWAGPDEAGRGHYYAIRGPSLLVEYDNTQNGANHIHSVWRDLANDWGEDLLAEHYRAGHPG